MIKQYLEQLFVNEAIAESTLKSRVGFLVSVANVVPGVWKDLRFLNNTKAVEQRIHDSEIAGTRFNRYAYIVAAIDSLENNPLTKKATDYYRKQLAIFEKLKSARQNDNRMTQHQIDNFKDIEGLQNDLTESFEEMFKKYNIKNGKVSKTDMARLEKIERKGDNLYRFAQEFQERMILACYVFQPAIRDNYSHMKFASSKAKTKNQSFNYFRFNRTWTECVMHMNIYKNVKVMGTDVQLGVLDTFVPYMHQWYNFLKLVLGKEPEYVFLYDIKMSDKNISWIDSKNGLTQRVKRASEKVFKRELTINSFRHCWEIYYHDHVDYKKMTIADAEKLHEMLMHNYYTAKQYNLISDHPSGPKE
jgi:hypothetical protein